MTFTPLEDARDELAVLLRHDGDLNQFDRQRIARAHAILQEQCRQAHRAAWRSEPTTPRVYDATNERWVG